MNFVIVSKDVMIAKIKITFLDCLLTKKKQNKYKTPTATPNGKLMSRRKTKMSNNVASIVGLVKRCVGFCEGFK